MKLSSFLSILSIVLLGFNLILFMGCISRQITDSLPVDITPTFSTSGQETLVTQWWTTFGDQQLNAFVRIALKKNLDLKTSWQRLQVAQAVLSHEKSYLWPNIDASLEVESKSPSSNSEGNKGLQLGLSSEYELDLWGKIKSAVDAQRYQVRATYGDYQTAAISLSAEITKTWFQLIEAQQQLKLIHEQIKTNEKMLFLLKVRFGNGQIRSVDILRQQQLVESSQEQKISIESEIQVTEHQLAVLLGRTPQEGIDYINEGLPALPPIPDTGIPTTLIRRRPDLQSAFYRLQAANRNLASAISQQFPRLSFSASLSKNTQNSENLFKDWIRSLVGNLLAPIFNGGQIKAEIKRSKAIKVQRLCEYGQIVLKAYQEVEDALIQEKKQQERIHSLERQLKLASQSYLQLRIEYFNGFANFLDVLTSLKNKQQLHRNLLSAKRILLEYRIALYRALAGGFEIKKELESQ